jgi:hypothetical protein
MDIYSKILDIIINNNSLMNDGNKCWTKKEEKYHFELFVSLKILIKLYFVLEKI